MEEKLIDIKNVATDLPNRDPPYLLIRPKMWNDLNIEHVLRVRQASCYRGPDKPEKQRLGDRCIREPR